MKQFIVLLSTVVLGIVIAGIIMGFGNTAENIGAKTNSAIVDVYSQSAIGLR